MKIFRLSGIAIILVFAGITWIVATLFVGGWLSNIIESQGTRANGASVTLSDTRLGWLEGSLQMGNIALANPDDLMRNRLELDKLTFDISFQELFKGHFHVDQLELKNIAIDQPRKTKAALYSNESGGIKNWAWPKAVVQKTQSIDANEVLKKVDIRSPEMYREFSEKLGSMKAEWQSQADALPDEKKIEQYKKEYETLKKAFDKANTLEKIKIAKELKVLTKKIRQDKEQVASFKQTIEKDIDAVQNDWRQLQQQVNKDTELAMSIVSLSPEGMKHLAASFLGEGAASWIKLALDNTDMLKSLTQSSKGEKAPPPEPREGIDVPFGNQPVKPAFWIKSTDISGKLGYNDLAGSVSGTAKNLASQLLPGNPMTAQLNFELPGKSASKAATGKLQFKAEHPNGNKTPVTANFSMADWPVDSWQAADGAVQINNALADVSMALLSGDAGTEINSVIRLRSFSLKADTANASSMIKHLSDVLGTTDQIELNIKVIRKDNNTEFNISSNLDNLFFAKIKEGLQAKANKVKNDVKNKIQSQVQEQRETIEQKLAALTDYNQLLKDKIVVLDKLN